MNIDEVIGNVIETLHFATLEVAYADLEVKRKIVSEDLLDISKEFFQDIFSGPSYSTWSRFTGGLTPLTEAYADRKLKEGKPTSFYQYKGQLRAYLSSFDAVKLWGAPKVTYRPAGTSALREGFYLNRANRPQVRGGGGFAKYDDAFLSLGFIIDAVIFPKLTGTPPNWYRGLGGTSSQYDKMKWFEFGTKKQVARGPFFTAMLEYQMGEKVRDALKGFL